MSGSGRIRVSPELLLADDLLLVVVIISGLPMVGAPAAWQVVWLVGLGFAAVVAVRGPGPDGQPGGDDGGNDDGGGGGGGLGRPRGPSPKTPAGTKP